MAPVKAYDRCICFFGYAGPKCDQEATCGATGCPLRCGGTWNGAKTQPTNNRVKALVIKPGGSAKLYAATYGGGVSKSTNSGVDWTACANTDLTNLNVISLTIDASGKLYAGTETGVFASTNDCATWNAMNTGLPN